jgi:signal transduction histidine kinase
MVVEAVGAVAVTGLLFAIVSRSWRRRRWYTMIEISGVVVIVGEVLGLVAIGRSLEGLYRFAAALVAIAGVVLALSLTVPGAMAYRAMRRVQRFTVLLDGAATDIPFEVALAGTLSDPGLRVGYPLGSGGPLVDHEGDVIEFAGSDRVSTALRVNDAIVAVVHHDAALSRGNVERQLGRQARMIAWNEGITAALRHRICELQASSRRTVQISDEERQRIERDLHDGAQQRLLALAFGLRRARQTASSPEAGASFDAALVDVKAALRELRELAQGIFPAILAESGLAAALQSLAERAAHPVVIDVAMDDMPLAASRTAYAVAQEAIQNASTPASITVTVRRIGTELVLSINGTAAELSTAVTDRVRAVGGRTHLDAASWRVIVPCAS